jgi:hypothetical protein
MFGRFNIPAVREFYGSTEGTYGTINIRTLIMSDTQVFVGSNIGTDPRFSCRLIWLQPCGSPAPAAPSLPLSLILSYLFVAIQKNVSLSQHIRFKLQFVCFVFIKIFAFST